jgi:O-antigen biosynthesis protein WbqP
MIAVRVESRGSPLFVQTRIGRRGKPFKMFKLRTMRADTGDLPSHEVGYDPVTRVGRVLRTLKLDELPQLVNVLAGSMSLVGPRPCLPQQQELIDARNAHDLFRIRPGVTGPAQLRGIDMSQPLVLAEVEADYFQAASFAEDLAVLFHTVVGKGRGDAARRASAQRPCQRAAPENRAVVDADLG